MENIYMTRVKADSVKYVLAVGLNWNPKYSYSALPEEYKGKKIPSHWVTMLTPVEPKGERISLFPECVFLEYTGRQGKTFYHSFRME